MLLSAHVLHTDLSIMSGPISAEGFYSLPEDRLYFIVDSQDERFALEL